MKKAVFAFILAILIAFVGAYLYLGLESSEKKALLISNLEVLGSAIVTNDLNYTLNFNQQNDLIHNLNKSEKIKIKEGDFRKTEIDSILIYRFWDQDPIELKPIDEKYTIFSVSIWKKQEYLKINMPDELLFLLATSTDL